MKKCSKCNKNKQEICFYENSRGGLCSACKVCVCKESMKTYSKNRERNLQVKKIYYQKNKLHLIKCNREWVKKNNWNKSDKRIEYLKKYYSNEDNREKRRKTVKTWLKTKKNNSVFKLNRTITSIINRVLKGKKAGRKWEILVGYSLQDLIQHIEKQFDEKMNWQNYGSYWHLDHIVPKSWFPYQTAEEQAFRDCWGLGNLQPLEAKKNKLKSNKFISIEK